MGIVSAGLCDIGMKRKTNQDAIYVNSEKNLFIVADGMGGHNGGDIASKLAIENVSQFMLDHIKEDPIESLTQAIKYANNVIKQKADKEPKLTGMGTTVVGLCFQAQTLYIANVGDSRSYLVNNRRLFQLTKDHSLVQEKLNIGLYGRQEAAADPQKNVLVRTVGFEPEVEVDVFTYQVCKNDIFLICSDGLHGKVSDPDILHIINESLSDPSNASPEMVQETVKKLVDQANANGGNDNISVILIVAN